VLLLPQSLLSSFLSSIHPPCAVAELGKHRYRGETAFPFILAESPSLFSVCGFILLFFLWRDAFRAFFLTALSASDSAPSCCFFNVILPDRVCPLLPLAPPLGKEESSTAFPARPSGVSATRLGGGLGILNERHMLYAWISLITVGLTDLYIRMVATAR